MSAQQPRPIRVLLLSGVLGFAVGTLAFPTLQVAVESAQVIAGIVTYPPDNPFGIYHLKLWTILHQALALFLLAGVPEIALMKFLSGVVFMLSFQALAMTIYALGADAVVAIGSPLVILLSRVVERGPLYPVSLGGISDTYGVIGLSVVLLVVGLAGAGCYRLAALLLGLAPAVHPALGMWLVIVSALCVAWDFRRLRASIVPSAPYFAAGCAITGISLALQLWIMRDIPPIAPAEASRYLTAFVEFWDGHRSALGFRSAGVALNILAASMALLWLYVFEKDLPSQARFILRFVVICAVFSAALVAFTHLPPASVPRVLLILMPSRLLNFNVLTSVALVLGLLTAYRQKEKWADAAIAVALGSLFFAWRSMLWDRMDDKPFAWFDPLAVVALAAAAAVILALATRTRGLQPARRATSPWRVATCVVAAVAVALTWWVAEPERADFQDHTNDPVFAAAAAEREGLLLTGGSMHLVQVRTRRPVLLDGGGLDMLPYALEGAPAMERILLDVYGIDLFDPPPESRWNAMVPDERNRLIWEGYTPEKWREIARRHGVTQVIVPARWSLRLPLAVEDADQRLYPLPR